MPQAPRARQVDVAERIRLFAEHHIVAVRTGRRNGEIIAIKHAAWGWISPKQYYAMQEFHALLPMIEKVVEGGYRIKESLWSISAVIGPVSVPIGLLIPVFEMRALLEAIAAKNVSNTIQWLYALFGPFGDIFAILGFIDFLGQGSSLDVAIGQSGNPALQGALDLAHANPLLPAVNLILRVIGLPTV